MAIAVIEYYELLSTKHFPNLLNLRQPRILTSCRTNRLEISEIKVVIRYTCLPPECLDSIPVFYQVSTLATSLT
jgi:hypothetical protein